MRRPFFYMPHLVLILLVLCCPISAQDASRVKGSGDMILEDGTGSVPGMHGADAIVNSIQRDPFYRVLEQLGWDNTSITDYDLNDLSLIGVVWDVPSPLAMFRAPRERRFIVKIGDRIGKNNGRVMTIGKGEVGVREIYTDINGNKTEKSTIKRVDRSLNGGMNE